MSTRAIRELVAKVKGAAPWADVGATADRALLEAETIERAAKDLTRLHLGEFTDDIAHRDNVVSAMTTPESQWEHPDVKAWSEAAVLLESIAKDAP